MKCCDDVDTSRCFYVKFGFLNITNSPTEDAAKALSDPQMRGVQKLLLFS